MKTNTHQPAILQSCHNPTKRGLSPLPAKTVAKLALSMLFAAGVLGQTACETRAGTGAAAGAGTGAVIGGPPGAAVGAGVGALGGAAMDERHGTRR